jgi:hypothetical protein
MQEPMIIGEFQVLEREKDSTYHQSKKKLYRFIHKDSNVRNREVQLQTKDYHKWKKKRKYGQRWMAETAFSSIKQMFGEYTSAIRFQNMVKEMTMKVSLYNLFRRIT